MVTLFNSSIDCIFAPLKSIIKKKKMQLSEQEVVRREKLGK